MCARPLTRLIGSYENLEITQCLEVLSTKQKTDCQASLLNHSVPHTSKTVSASTGVANAATSGALPLPPALNTITSNNQAFSRVLSYPNRMPVANHESGPKPVHPLAPSVAMALAQYNKGKRRSGIRIRP